jgi:transcriptional regulator with XRE-family HTH domain
VANATDPTEDRQRLAAALRDLRTRAGFSTYQLAEVLGWSQTKVSKIERGQSPADPDDVALWATAVNAAKTQVTELVALASAVADQMHQWREVHGRGLAARQRELAVIHSAMTGYREFAPYAVPGFLQTEPYAARVLELADVALRGGIGDAVAERMARQAVLLNPSRSFRFVVTEAALHIGFGPEEVMRDQGAKILATMNLPNVSLAVLPIGGQAPALMPSGFVIYDLPGEPMVLVELLSREIQLRAAWDVQVHEDAFARLEAAAVTGDEAAALVRSAVAA